MWTWSLNWGRITPHIVIGTCPMKPADVGRIRSESGASAVLCLQHDDCLSYWGINYPKTVEAGTRLGLVMQRCPIRDFDVPDIRKRLPRAISMLTGLLADGHRTYVHCTAGLGRAPVVVLGYLTLVEGLSPQVAIERILRGRPGAVPAWEAYQGCRQDLVARHRTSIERRAYAIYKRGNPGDAEADWLQAEAEILRSVLTNPKRSAP